MKRIVSTLLICFVLLLSACTAQNQEEIQNTSYDPYEPVFTQDPNCVNEQGELKKKYRTGECTFGEMKYGAEKDPAKQEVVSDRLASTGGPCLDRYVALSDLIVVGTVIGDGNAVQTEIKTGTPVDDKIKEMTGGELPKFNKYYHYIEPEKILWQLDGSKRLDGILNVYQFASEIQMKKGDKVVCFLNDRNELGWVAVSFEHALFKVTEAGKMSSFSDYKELSQYDDLTLDQFEELVTEYITEFHYAIPYKEYETR